MRFCILFLLILSSCERYYISVSQEWVDARYLASFHAKTPDPRLDHPPVGQMLILSWFVPKEIFKQKSEVLLDLIFWDYTTKTLRFPIEHRLDYTSYKLLNEEYEKSGGILTYRAKIVTQEGEVYREWKHQLWVELITIDQEGTVQEEIDR